MGVHIDREYTMDYGMFWGRSRLIRGCNLGILQIGCIYLFVVFKINLNFGSKI